MLAEWKKNTLEHYKKYAETAQFDQLKDIADCGELYSFFYPLGITTNGIHSIARVCSDLYYAVEDDGDLSIVLSYELIQDRLSDELKKLIKNKRFTTTNVFIMYDHHQEICDKDISRWALYHCPDNTLEKFVVKRFNYDVLTKLHSFVPRFQEATKLAHQADNDDELDPELKFIKKKVLDYHNYKKETDKLIEQMVLDL